jgi:CubicO group peptidase (beta-lactamase class C family)
VAELVQPQRVGMFDQTLMHQVDLGLGFLLESSKYGPNVPYGYGPHASPRTYGHGGAQCAQGYCDPEAGLVVAYVFNGRPGEAQHQRRALALNTTLYEALCHRQP